MKVLIGFLMAFFVSYSAVAKEIKAKSLTSGIKIESIGFRIFDRQKGMFVENGKQSDPYGLQSDVFVSVKLSGLGEKEVELKVTATTPKVYDEARGETAATTQSGSLVVFAPDTSVSSYVTIPFIFHFHCDPMTIEAKIVGLKVTKKITAPFGCAE